MNEEKKRGPGRPRKELTDGAWASIKWWRRQGYSKTAAARGLRNRGITDAAVATILKRMREAGLR